MCGTHVVPGTCRRGTCDVHSCFCVSKLSTNFDTIKHSSSSSFILPYLLWIPLKRTPPATMTALQAMMSFGRLLKASPRKQHQIVSACRSSFGAFFSTTIEDDPFVHFREKGIVDERNLTVFETLHEMQVRSCQVYAPKKLFGTFSDDTKQFEWMTYEEYAAKVDQCRSMLHDIGK